VEREDPQETVRIVRTVRTRVGTGALALALHPPPGRIDGPNGPMGHWRSGDAPEWNDPADDVVR
jgi:hypothetical protein